jgi:peptide-methionine (S)-S-oxide reductase
MNPTGLKTITLGGGCFWCLEAVFVGCKGIVDVESGYCNGHLPNPTYEAVCSGASGHVEVVKLVFDTTQISQAEVLEVFFTIHDPTTPNRQGNDVGTQYRSGIYTHTPEQQAQCAAFVQQLNDSRAFGQPVVTEVQPISAYHVAEAYHQDYFERNPNQGYCAFVVAPKVQKFRQTLARLVA